MNDRRWASATLAIWALGLGACSTGAEYWSANSTMPVPRASMAQQLADYDVVFLGEDHGHVIGHAEHLALVEAIHEVRSDMALSFEQIERDAAPALQQFLQGEADEAQFIEAMGEHKWPHYERDYRPIVMFAKENGLPVIAANLPKELAIRVSREGPASVEDEPLAARELWTPDGAYRENFRAVMGMSGETLDRYYAAQCLKDCTMAESIADFLASAGPNPPLVIHKNGTFHSDGHLGTVQMLERMRPDLKVAVVTMVSGDEKAGDADFVLRVPVYERPASPASHPSAAKHPVAAGDGEENPHKHNPHQANPHGTNPHAANPHGAAGDAPAMDPGGRPALGFKPGYDAEVIGCLIEAVTPGGHADKAGLKGGDVIVELGKLPVEDVRGYMEALGTVDIGQKVEIVVVRGTEEKTFQVMVGSR